MKLLSRHWPGPKGLFVAALLALVLGACGPIIDLKGQGDAPRLYTLGALMDDPVPASETTGRTLMVEEPEAFAALDTRKIALMPEDREIRFYANAEWIDRLPRMVQTLLITSFEETGLFKDVGAENMPLAADYRLVTGLRTFNADYTANNGPVVTVTLMVRLFRTRSLDLVDSRLFNVSEPVGSDRMGDIIATFDRVNRKAMDEIVDWTARQIREADGQNTAP